MLRKLLLSGLLQFVDRGTAFQVFCGCMLSFFTCIVQVWVRPYRDSEANIPKLLVEMQIFVAFLISFILRVLPQISSSEPVSADAYGWLLVATLGSLLATAVGLTTHQAWRRHRDDQSASVEEGAVGGETVLELNEGLVVEEPLPGRAK